MNTSDAWIARMKGFEGLSLTAYQDVGGVWTIGWGHTGPEVKAGMTITNDQAVALLKADLAKFEQAVQSLLTRTATQPQFDALVDLAYNIGVDKNQFQRSSVLKRFNEGDIVGAAEAFAFWMYAGGQIQADLVLRRGAEIARFMSQA